MITLPKGWFMRDVNKAVEQRACFAMLKRMTTKQLAEWKRAGRAIMARSQ